MTTNEHKYPYHFYLRNSIHKIMMQVDSELVQYDITNQQARVVGFIGEKQDEGITVYQKDIESYMDITGASVSNLLRGLEKKGFIERIRSASDDRVKELSLTPKGRELIATFNSVFSETENKIVQGMTKEQKELFLELLKMVVNNFDG
ncbi:MarR family winged helix-turn-helix transcriptional regulator [Methanosarcina sp. T3]|uniref:MarR family winged helix-turn-helix transcriptional regulator n=1 Tax=Methanosarcina sp. T3 TaxID=3439062 RepID=UPI003F856C38